MGMHGWQHDQPNQNAPHRLTSDEPGFASRLCGEPTLPLRLIYL